ncbi:Holliday junction DNA helicase RuvA [Ammoniphilus oxalaticus]|uniref:Holliday junction branch migration complex subunit RuvA n=1 Tax=Ammoniphilus oxalaticus TaxID=66863 RepID=A0A419SJ26_9BACL|nr:Holliday junction branch migration protein RuvA [Ammoniphilus oxalaticus]RKD23918.1 Holliday junction DNA helicase RuvA [Ammoniphilus oxalaticus]
MIDFIDGQVEYVESDSVVLETTQGIGYRIFCPNPYAMKVKESLRVYTHHHVRDDAISLYGFRSRDKRGLFRKLLDVTGIGPRGALAIIAAAEPHQIVTAVQHEDMNFLTKFPGVGKKTAGRMILELKDKLNEFLIPGSADGLLADPMAEGQTIQTSSSITTAFNEASEALLALGYSENEVRKVMAKLHGETDSTEELIKKALQLFISS